MTFSALAAVLAGCRGGFASPSSLQPPLASGNARAGNASASEQVVYSFTGGTDGGDPAADLNFDANGNVDGTTVVGGDENCGTVFQLQPRSSPPWQETVLYSFTRYGDGKNPYGGVTFAQGNLYGTTESGGTGGSCGSTGCGVAWQLNMGSESVLHSFTGGDDGFGPGGGLTLDNKGRFYGTTRDGGVNNSGVIYQLFRISKGKSRELVVHAFSGGSKGGGGSLGRLLYDPAPERFYGVTQGGGAHRAGTVYVLYRNGGGHHGNWPVVTLHAFNGRPDCGSPYGGLTSGIDGNLYGTTYDGGRKGRGCVFELYAAKSWADRVVYSFKGGNDGSNPTGTLLLRQGSLYGTTSMGGGSCDCGTVFMLNAKTGAETILHAFSGGRDGAYPYYGLLREPNGHLLGTTATGGTSNQGVIFEVTPVTP